MNKKYKIRTMHKNEIADIAIAWAKDEGWNPGLYDAECFYAADPKGFFVGELDKKPISCISAVRYDKKFGFLGFYIVKPHYRGNGYGITIFNKALQYMGKRNIGGDGVLRRIGDYKKLGFKPAYKNRRYRGYGTGSKTPINGLQKTTEVDFAALCAYDAAIFPAKRHLFLKYWLKQPGTKSYVYTLNGIILGFGVIRPCFEGYKIGPLFADDSAVATKIFGVLVGSVQKNEKIFFDVPEINPSAITLAQKYNMRVVFETMRIYSCRQPQTKSAKIFGLTSFELG